MRLTPTMFFKEIFPDRRDVNNPGNYLCRFCGKPTNDSRRRFYCSDRCYNLCQKAVSWVSVRTEVWKRDQGECVLCGTPVFCYNGWYVYGEGGESAACHHKIPVRKLNGMAWDAVFNEDWINISPETKNFWYCRFYVMLYLDPNNLITLCSGCHKMVHVSDNREKNKSNPFKVKRKWKHFWKLNDQLGYTRTLEEFIIA